MIWISGNVIFQQLMILKGMVAVFVFCQCFTIGADSYELICTLGGSMSDQTMCDTNVHIERLINVAHLMLALNSSVNFIFYMMNIEEFRKKFVKVICTLIISSYKSLSEKFISFFISRFI